MDKKSKSVKSIARVLPNGYA